MAGAAPADALHAGTDEPDTVERDAAGGAGHAGTSHTKDSTFSSPSLQPHDQLRDGDGDDDDDDHSVASSTGTAGRRSIKSRGEDRFAALQSQAQQQRQRQQQQQQRPLRKSASTSTTDTVASAQTNASTEVRAAVSNRASRSALNQRSKSALPSPTIPQGVDHDFDPTAPSPSSRHQDSSVSYVQAPVNASASSPLGLTQLPDPDGTGIVQVNPAPPPSPPPQHRGRSAMASTFLPALFGRRRPTSSASAASMSSGFAAKNPAPPGPQAFDFNSILSSLEADDVARADIDAIAQICGHSRLSLANAHANHRDPVGEVVGSPTASSQYPDAFASSGLEPVRETGASRGDQGETRAVGSPSASQAGDDRWQMGGSSERDGDDRGIARQAARGISGVAFGRSASVEEEGRARRQLTRVRDTSGERDQRRRR